MLLKILFLTLGLVGVGLPFDTVWHYSYAFLIAFVFVYTVKRDAVQIRTIMAGCCLLLAAYYVPKISIIEQQRLLVEKGKIISPTEFITNVDAYPFSQTADGYLQNLGLSRKVRDVALINAPRYLRSGYLNKGEYNFYGPSPALVREYLPFVVRYKITESIVQRGFLGQGIFYFNGNFFTNSTVKNITFKNQDLGSYFYAFASDGNLSPIESMPRLILNLAKTFQYTVWLVGEILFKILGLLFIAHGLFTISRKSLDWREVFVLFSMAAYFLIKFHQRLWVDNFALGGCDGIIHGGYPYTMLEAIVRGDWYTAIQSPETIFYFMPGMRYVRLCEILAFGDAYPLQLMVVLFSPVICYRFFKVLLPPNYAFGVCVLMATELFNYLGMRFSFYHKSFFMLYGEGFAYACLTGGLVVLLKGISSRARGIGCFSLFAIAASIRPNLLVFLSCCSLIYFFLPTFSNSDKRYKLIDMLGLSPLLLIPLHNFYFGHKLVLLTAAAGIRENLPLHPKMYLHAIQSLGGLIAPFAFKAQFINHFNLYGYLVLLFMATNLRFAVCYGLKNKRGALAAASFLGLSMHLFYLANTRYLQPYFIISVILLLVFMRDLGCDLKIKRLQALSQNCATI